jgi:hypothetical protein
VAKIQNKAWLEKINNKNSTKKRMNENFGTPNKSIKRLHKKSVNIRAHETIAHTPEKGAI